MWNHPQLWPNIPLERDADALEEECWICPPGPQPLGPSADRPPTRCSVTMTCSSLSPPKRTRRVHGPSCRRNAFARKRTDGRGRRPLLKKRHAWWFRGAGLSRVSRSLSPAVHVDGETIAPRFATGALCHPGSSCIDTLGCGSCCAMPLRMLDLDNN